MQASHSNNDRHYEQKDENLPQSESERTFLKVVNTLLLGLRIFNNFVVGTLHEKSNCIISVDMT